MVEQKLLAAFMDSRKEFDVGANYVKRDELSPMGKHVFAAIKGYYDLDPDAEFADHDVIRSQLERKIGQVPKHKRELNDYLTELAATEASAVNVVKELIEQRKSQIGRALAEALLIQDDAVLPSLLEEYVTAHDATELETDIDEIYTGASLDDFEQMYKAENLIKVAPPDLNRRLRGGLIRGQHLILAAMPETGKSLFALNMTAGFLQQRLRVLYVGNEDPIPELVLRLLSNLTGRTQDDLFADKEAVMVEARERGYDLVTFVGLSPGNLNTLDSLLRKGNYDVLVVDQLRNLDARAENNTTRLETVARGVRNLCRKHKVLGISVTQGAESARDNLVLNTGDIDGSNIGIPGACDVIVMVGVNDDYYKRDLRRLTLCKNKRGGNHDDFTVGVDRYRSRVHTI